MSNPAIKDYVDQARAKNIPDQTIRDNLISTGWTVQDVASAMGGNDDLEIPVPLPVPQPPSTTKTVEDSMWDTFQNVLLVISLYVMATSIALIIHLLIDEYVPGYDNSYAYSGIEYMLRGYLAALIVSFPLFVFFFLNTARRAIKNPEIRKSESRRKTIYITLVITFIIMLFNIISIVYRFLGGNVSINSLLHFVTTVSISGLIFGYYIYQVREDRKIHV